MNAGCEACGRRLYFSERVVWPSQFCFPCATVRGVIRLADRNRWAALALRASKLAPWWAWTTYLEHALCWTDEVRKRYGRDAAMRIATRAPSSAT